MKNYIIMIKGQEGEPVLQIEGIKDIPLTSIVNIAVANMILQSLDTVIEDIAFISYSQYYELIQAINEDLQGKGIVIHNPVIAKLVKKSEEVNNNIA